jgi:hypothetical protein
MSRVSEDEVLLLWRALRAFRSGARPLCAPRGRPRSSECPLYESCPRWRGQPDDRLASMEETTAETDRRRSSWPCSRLLDLLSPDLTKIGS